MHSIITSKNEGWPHLIWPTLYMFIISYKRKGIDNHSLKLLIWD